MGLDEDETTSEVLWTPFGKLWCYCWRKMNSYL